MGFFKRAPRVTIYSPKTLLVGRPYDVEVVIEAEEPLQVDYVDARIEGVQGWTVGAGKSRTSRQANFPELALRMMTEGMLPIGETRLRARFTLPEGTPPSHTVHPAWAYVDMHVRVAIPWWPDGHYRFTLPVRIPPPGRIDRRPAAFRSSGDDPDDKRLEISLSSTTFVAGETVTGACALYHVDDSKERELEIALVPRLELLGAYRTRERDSSALSVTFRLPAGSAGTNIPFRFDLPTTIIPTFETLTHRLRWVLVASSGSFFRGKVELAVPITIVDASAVNVVQELAPAPRLADERIGQLFDQLARRDDWERVRTKNNDEVAIERAIATTIARMSYTYRGEDGTFVVSTVEPPSLGLGLAVKPSSSLRHVFFEDIEVDIADWDRHHLVAARAAAQATPFLKQVVPALKGAGALGTMVRWNDDEIVFERQIATLEEPQLREMSTTLAHVAAVIHRAALDIPPPPDVTVDVAAWRELANQLDGTIGMGDLSIECGLEHGRVALGLVRLDGRPHGIRISAGDPGAAGAELRAITLHLARPREQILSTQNVEPLVELVLGWPDDIVELRIHDGVASAMWLLPSTKLPVVDVARVRQLVESLRAALVALAPGAGPYR